MTPQPTDQAQAKTQPRRPLQHLHRLWPWALTAVLLGSMGPAHADTPASATPAPPHCDSAAAMPGEQLVGLWQLTLWPETGSATSPVSQGAVLFEPHPEYPGSVRGRLKRTTPGNDVQALLSGDVVNDEFNLDESDDGVRMSANWVGTPAECGMRLRGVRQPAAAMGDTGTVLRFELRKAAN